MSYDNGEYVDYTYDNAGNITHINSINTLPINEDTDNAGIADSWEMTYFGDLTTANATSDYDGDGYSDLTEFNNSENNYVDSANNSFDPISFNSPGGNGYEGVLPSNDDFQDIMLITSLDDTYNGSNVGATLQTNEPDHLGQGENSVWWKWQPEQSATYTFSTDGSDFDTVLAIYTGTTLSNLVLVSENDDYDNVSSQVTFDAVAGTSYYLAIDGSSGSQGEIVLTGFLSRLKVNMAPINLLLLGD